jgi:hypothetical protein
MLQGLVNMPTKKDGKKLVAVVVPLHYRNYLTSEEEISKRHLDHFLGAYDKYVAVADSLKVDFPGYGIKKFKDKYFGSAEAYRKLTLSRHFYNAFREYKYILIYQLDCLVLSDQLTEWCEKDFDYIGAPWIKGPDTPWVTEPAVGNSGFALHKVESFLKVFDSNELVVEPDRYWADFRGSHSRPAQVLNLPRKHLKKLKAFNGVECYMRRYRKNSDRFWSLEAKRFYPDFNIAPVDIALRFSFEVEPRRCFEMNNHSLPFGCHAWPKYDRQFWEPYLIK